MLEHADTSDRLRLENLQGLVPGVAIFVYRTEAALEAWSKDGWTDAYCHDMVTFISLDTGLTCVVENPTDDSLAAVRKAL